MPKIDISLLDIINYVGGRDRPIKEGERVFKAGHIILCGVKVCDPKTITSLCLQTSALKSLPHEIEIKVTEDLKDWHCVCSCKAGQSGFCKHVVATLLYINRHEDLELLGSTDLTQVWGKEKKGIDEMYDKKNIEEFWCHKPRKENFESHETIDKRNLNRLILCNKFSAIYKFIERKDQLDDLSRKMARVVSSPTVMHKLSEILKKANKSEFLDNIDVDLSAFQLEDCCQKIICDLRKSDQLAIASEYNQKSDMWKKERQLRITGSRCYSIYTFSKDDWEKKAIDYFFPSEFSSKYTEHGTMYEQEALNFYKLSNQCEVLTLGLIVCKRFPWLGYSPDGIVIKKGRHNILLEIKCPYAGNSIPASEFVNTCDYLITINNQLTLKKKHKIFGQIQFGMALLNLPEAHLVIYSVYSKSFVQVVVNFDEAYAKSLIETVSNKYLSKMLHVFCKNKHK